MKILKRIVAIIMTIVLSISLQKTVYASENNTTSTNIDKFTKIQEKLKNVKKAEPATLKTKTGAFETLFWDTFGHGTTTVSSNIIDKIKDASIKKLSNYNAKTLKEAAKYQKMANSFEKGITTSKSYTRIKYLKEYNSKTSNALKQISKNKGAQKLLKYGAKGLDVASIAEDAYHYNDRVHKHATLDFIARSVRGCSMIASTLALPFKASPNVKAASLTYGLTKDVLVSETFVKAADNYDCKTLLGMDILMESVNSFMIDLFGGDGKTYFKSHMSDFSERYRLLQGGKKTPAGAPCYKPNIYIYPKESTNIEVTFDYPALLTKTIPDYSGKWEAKVEPDGMITDTDGNKYRYLFYESETDIELFQKDKGWYIKADSRKETYTKILTAYGLNKQEINDFNEYWTEKLDSDKDYIMYPQLTDTVDAAMPLDISPMPENIYRVWFVFCEATNKNQKIPHPEIKKFNRSGYTVVEWGGIIQKKEVLIYE